MLRNRFENGYQMALILLSFCIIVLLGVFIYNEVFPEYKHYQKAYTAIEDFRSEITGDPTPEFSYGVKQVLIPQDHQGPEEVDRCTSCHVAINLPHFSPLTPKRDINGNLVYDETGSPVFAENPNYIWGQLERKIAELTDPEVLSSLSKEEKEKQKEQADELYALRYQKVSAWGGSLDVDMAKVLTAHPFIGAETQLFDLHPIEEYGCTTCHSGNGRSLVAKRAHGAYFDREVKDQHAPSFTEIDKENDPKFSGMFNERPEGALLFQTTPLLTGTVIESRCVQCHETGKNQVLGVAEEIDQLSASQEKKASLLETSHKSAYLAASRIVELYHKVQKEGLDKTYQWLQSKLEDSSLSDEELDYFSANLSALQSIQGQNKESTLHFLANSLQDYLGKQELVKQVLAGKQSLAKVFPGVGSSKSSTQLMEILEDTQKPLEVIGQSPSYYKHISPDVSDSLKGFEKGQFLFVNNACYTCHRVEGLSRGGVGPDLTEIGLSYPWYIKESIVWPQADLKSSVMPNFRLDHEELEGLMTFLLAQRGSSDKVSAMDRTLSIKQWEEGKRVAWEKPIAPDKMQDLDYGMEIFATEGCSACHSLKGFSSSVGLRLDAYSQWFSKLFPQGVIGSEIAQIADRYPSEIDDRIIIDAHPSGVLDTLAKEHPGLIESYYTHFKFARRSKDGLFAEKMAQAKTDSEKQQVLIEEGRWKERIDRIMLTYIQEYGFGRDIAPNLSYSGIYRSTEWLMGHFKNPSQYTIRSFMPAFPFDETKFYSLTYMLETLGLQNQKRLQSEFIQDGFQPELAYQELCQTCHGAHQGGNGPVSEMLYPIPKKLNDPTFLVHLTKEKAFESVLHGVSGTPMPPWGESSGKESPVLSSDQARQLVDWLYADLPVESQQQALADKWSYTTKDFAKELKGASEESSYFEKTSQGEMIRQSLYSDENILEGQALFMANCAHCHGKDADGAGERSVNMEDAKPRALTNLPWLRSKDDLRLLQSIKYGVPGTSMTPWGDKTSAMQRMQLVMFIRDLSQQKAQEEELKAHLYRVFGESELVINQARAGSYNELSVTKKRLEMLEKELVSAKEEATVSQEMMNKAVALYQKQLELDSSLKSLKEKDGLYLSLLESVKKEGAIFYEIAASVVEQVQEQKAIEAFEQLIRSQQARLIKGKSLVFQEPSKALFANQDKLLNCIEGVKKHLQNELVRLKGQLPTKQVQELKSEVEKRLNSLTTLHTEVARDLMYAQRLRDEQKAILGKIETTE